MTTRLSDWRARCAAAPLADPLALIGPAGLVVLAPHPDDESLGASALLAAAAQAGRPIGLVALTDGEASHRGSSAFPPERLAGVRRAEQEAALTELGCGAAKTLRLGLPDGAAGQEADIAGLAGRIAAFCDAIGATVLAATAPFDPHPDHEAAARLAEAVRTLRPGLRLLFFPIWTVRLGAGERVDAAGLHPFRLTAPLAVKRAAIARHESQLGRLVTDDPEGFALQDWFLAHHDGPFEEVYWSAMPGRPPGASHFARLYREGGDPWHVRTAPYERDKRAATIGALGQARFEASVEIGCGEGHLTALLAARSARTLGLDLDPSIIGRARDMHRGVAGLSFETGRLPEDFPALPFDLLVLSEILYFLTETEIETLLAKADALAEEGARMLLVNYLGETGTPLSGDMAADFLIASATGWRRERAERHDGFRLDLLVRA